VIAYPDDAELLEWANAHSLPPASVLRDVARLVEILNLRHRGFFDSRSVLAGSMALRAFGSPRFTIYDTDLSTEADVTPTALNQLLSYEDDDLKITPEETTPTGDGGGVWRTKPVIFEPYFSDIALANGDNDFAVDTSQRGLVRDGAEQVLLVPYASDLGIWGRDEPPSVWMMSLSEICAEKILGWAANRLAKHYADVAFIGGAYAKHLDRADLRSCVMDKLTVMTALQPQNYMALATLDDVVATLRPPVELPPQQWQTISYVTRSFSREDVQSMMLRGLIPMLEHQPGH